LSPLQSETIFVGVLRGLALLSGLIVLVILFFLLQESLPFLNTIGISRFFKDPAWHPVSGEYYLLPMLWGSLLVTAGSVLLATPLGILSAVFCQYYAPPAIAQVYRRLIELLAGIPSVVYGFWGLVVLVPLIGRLHPPGPSLLAGILILSIMILPTIALVADASFTAVPLEYLRGAAALGLGRWATVCGVVLPAAKAGLMTGIILETGRALGETMAVLMVCGNVVQVPESLFAPMRTLTANIALEIAYAVGDHRAALFVSGLVLMGLVVILVAIAEVIHQGQLYD
jgi:phosphate transport system permease protein